MTATDWSKVPHEMVEKPVRDTSPATMSAFRDEYGEWCEANGVTSRMLDEATDTNMGHHWSRHPTQPAIPTPDYWDTLRGHGYAPEHLDHYVGANEMVPVANVDIGTVEGAGRHRNDFDEVLTSGDYKSIIGEEYGCVEPTAPTRPALVVDPFGGTGTVAGVAATLGRFGISNDLSADYNRLAIWRITESGHFGKTEQRMWRDRQEQML